MIQKNKELIYTQLDRIDGETAGFLLEQLHEIGVRNVQLIPSITKKGRPGYVLIIDACKTKKEKIFELLLRDYSVTGYHLIPTQHYHIQFQFKEEKIQVTNFEKEFFTTITYKYIEETDTIHLEHDDCISLQKQIKQNLKLHIPLMKLKEMIKDTLLKKTNQLTLIKNLSYG